MALAEIMAVSGLAGISCSILPGPNIIDFFYFVYLISFVIRLRGFLHGNCKGPVNGETACICDTVQFCMICIYFSLGTI